jgi:hypothetical protein
LCSPFFSVRVRVRVRVMVSLLVQPLLLRLGQARGGRDLEREGHLARGRLAVRVRARIRARASIRGKGDLLLNVALALTLTLALALALALTFCSVWCSRRSDAKVSPPLPSPCSRGSSTVSL